MSIDPKIFEIAIPPQAWSRPAPALLIVPSALATRRRLGATQQTWPNCGQVFFNGRPPAKTRGDLAGSARVRDHVLLQLFRDCPEVFDKCGHERCRLVTGFCQNANFPSRVWQEH